MSVVSDCVVWIVSSRHCLTAAWADELISKLQWWPFNNYRKKKQPVEKKVNSLRLTNSLHLINIARVTLFICVSYTVQRISQSFPVQFNNLMCNEKKIQRYFTCKFIRVYMRCISCDLINFYLMYECWHGSQGFLLEAWIALHLLIICKDLHALQLPRLITCYLKSILKDSQRRVFYN